VSVPDSPSQKDRVASVDVLRGLVMIRMALDHVRMYFGYGTWYSDPTNLATTTPLLFFTRWITHFCAPVFFFLAGTSAFLYSMKKTEVKALAWFLFPRGLWLIFVELVIVNFAWTFDITYSFRILQVIWAIGVSMVALAGLVFLPNGSILVIGLILVFGHNLFDSVTVQGTALPNLIWYALLQPNSVFIDSTHLISFVYPVLPWIGLMAVGYVSGTFYTKDVPVERRRRWLMIIGISVTLLFFLLRGFNLYGEPRLWREQNSLVFSAMSFLNTTKYPPSLHFLLMTIGPALIFLSISESIKGPIVAPFKVFGRAPFFFYVIHLYFIHALALLWLVSAGRDWHAYILSARAITSGSLSSFGLGLEAVYLIWMLVILSLYPLCRWYQKYRENNPSRWLRYL